MGKFKDLINKLCSSISKKKPDSLAASQNSRVLLATLSLCSVTVGFLWFMLGATSLSRWSNLGMVQVYWDSLGGVGSELSAWFIAIGGSILWITWRGACKVRAGQVGLFLLSAGLILLTGSFFVSWRDANHVDNTVIPLSGAEVRANTSNRLTAIILPLRQDFSGLEKITDISYGPHGKLNTLDLIRPSNHQRKKMPILLHAHGGGFVSSDKSMESMPLLLHMAHSGWLVATMNYRLGPADRWPAQREDINQAIEWLRLHASDYGGDPNFIAASGGSAGGNLVSLAGLSPSDLNITRLQAVVSFYAAYDMLKVNAATDNFKTNVLPQSDRDNPELWRSASPKYYISSNAPPFFIVQGALDGLAIVENAREFAELLRAKSRNTVIYVELAGAHHGFDHQNSLRVAGLIDGVQRFLDFEYARHLQTHSEMSPLHRPPQ